MAQTKKKVDDHTETEALVIQLAPQVKRGSCTCLSLQISEYSQNPTAPADKGSCVRACGRKQMAVVLRAPVSQRVGVCVGVRAYPRTRE